MRGIPPKRPPSVLSDTLRELLMAMRAVQRAQEPQGRPTACIVLERLKECVDHWGKSIIPPPESWQENGRCRMSPRKCYSLFTPLLRRQVLTVMTQSGGGGGGDFNFL